MNQTNNIGINMYENKYKYATNILIKFNTSTTLVEKRKILDLAQKRKNIYLLK